MLNSGPVSYLELEKSVNELFKEWLEGFFDGQSHNIGSTQGVEFPDVDVVFQEADPGSPQVKPVIHWLWVSPGAQKQSWERTSSGKDRIAMIRQTWVVLIKAAGGELPEMVYRARSVSDKLVLICNHLNARSDLEAKGLMLKKATVGIAMRQSGATNGAYAIRRINVTGILRCPMGELVE